MNTLPPSRAARRGKGRERKGKEGKGREGEGEGEGEQGAGIKGSNIRVHALSETKGQIVGQIVGHTTHNPHTYRKCIGRGPSGRGTLPIADNSPPTWRTFDESLLQLRSIAESRY